MKLLEGNTKIARLVTSVILRVIDWLDLKNNTLTTYRVKKLTPERKSIIRNSNIDSRNLRVGIVIQGQVIPTLTFRICERYKSLYPNANIVVSTWKNQQTGDLEKIQQLGIYLIENEIPGFSGPGNINLQIASTKAGIEFCKEKNSDYILKNRSDTWLSSDYFLEYLSYMHETFASADNKIIVPSYNSFLFRLYSPTDQIQFGKLDILQTYWDCHLVDEETKDFRFAESYLLRSYLNSNKRIIKDTIEDSLSVYRDYFVIAENSELGLVLNKGTKVDVSNRWASDGFLQPMSEIRFWQWLDLQKDLSRYLLYYEELPYPPAG